MSRRKENPREDVELTSYVKSFRSATDSNVAVGETVLGLLILAGSSALTSITEIVPEWFTNKEQRELYAKIRDIAIDGKENVLSELSLKGEDMSKITQLMSVSEYQTGTWELQNHVNSLRKTYRRVKFFEMVDELVLMTHDTANDPDKLLATAHSKLVEIETDEKETADIVTAVNEFTEMQKTFEENEGGNGFIGIPAGFTKLDGVIDGLRPGHFWVIGGYTSTGKTWFLLNIINNILTGNKVSFFSLEMSRVDIVSRLLAIQTGIGATKVLRHEFADLEAKKKFDEAKERLLKSDLKIYSKTMDLEGIIMTMTRDIIRNGTKIFAIDYVQLIKTKSKNEYEQISEVSQRLQNFARENGITILVLSQISNEHARDPNAEVMGFKGGGTLPASVDLAIELFNEDKKEERDQKVVDGKPFDVKVIIKKNRHGRTGHINMEFTPWNGRFDQSIFNDDY